MGELNSDDHYIYYCGQESHRRNGVALIINKRIQNAVLGCSLKNDTMILVHFQGKLFSITICWVQVYASIAHAEEAETDQFYEDLGDFLERTPKKDFLFIVRDWNAKVGSPDIPGVTGKFDLGEHKEAGQRLTASCQENALVIYQIPFLNNTRDNFTYGCYQVVNTEIKLFTFFVVKDGEAVYSQQKQDLKKTVAQTISFS